MNSDQLFNRARALHGKGNVAQAGSICEGIVKRQPDHVGALYLLGMIAYQQGNYLKALLNLDKAIALVPRQVNFHVNRGLILQELGRLEEAVLSHDRAIALDPRQAQAHYYRGSALQMLGRTQEAIAGYDASIAREPHFVEAYVSRGGALQELSKLEAAVADYDAALAIQPNLVECHFRRALALFGLERCDAAIAAYDRVIALQPDLVAAHFNRANILKDLRRLDDAQRGYERALALQPQNVDIKRGVFACNFQRLRNPALVERLSIQISTAGINEECSALRTRLNILGYRAFHELEYTEYLMACGFGDANLVAANKCFREICSREPASDTQSDLPQSIAITAAESEAISRFMRTAPRYQVPARLGKCLNEGNDWAALEEQYLQSTPEITFIDNMLSEECLAALRKFCLVSPVWRREYEAHYLGANCEEGFVSSLHLQIASELQQKMPRVFGDHDLTQLWAFKYSSAMGRGTNVHADFARVNLNFWITPDDANLDPNSGGLVIYDVPAPRSWSQADYNRNRSAEKIHAFLKKHSARTRTIPYRCNRAVLFNSNLFHETDRMSFRPGYQNRRINVTYLWGIRFAD